MVSYSPRAAQALGWLKRPFNDVEIFVEDTGNHNMWLHVCRNLLRPGTRISSVNMLGGRDAVVEACRRDQRADGRRKLYIIDGDFDFLLGKRKPPLKFLYRLRAYCVENLLFTENALVQVGLESRPTYTEQAVAAAIRYRDTIAEADNALRPLFVTYATVFSEARPVRTVRLPVNDLFDSRPGGVQFSPEKIRVRAFRVWRQASRHATVAQLRRVRTQIAARAASLSLSQTVSGKDYLLPFILTRFKACCGYGLSAEQFKVALSRSFERASEPFLARRLSRL